MRSTSATRRAKRARPEASAGGAPPLDALAIGVASDPDPAWRRRTRRLLGWLAPEPGERLLDAGSGRGHHLHLLSRWSEARLVGVERDGEVLGEAWRALRARDELELLRGDLTALPLGEGAIDKVLCCDVLEHVADDAGALHELHRVLRPGGRLALGVPHGAFPLAWDPVNRLLEMLLDTHVQTGFLAGIWAGHLRLYRPDELEARVRAAGFEVLDRVHETRRCVPFSHNLLYDIGARALLAGRVPARWAKAADRHRRLEGAEPQGARRGAGLLYRLARGVFDGIDRLNPEGARAGPSVDLCLLARKPA